jgi:hypothetical protein
MVEHTVGRRSAARLLFSRQQSTMRIGTSMGRTRTKLKIRACFLSFSDKLLAAMHREHDNQGLGRNLGNDPCGI